MITLHHTVLVPRVDHPFQLQSISQTKREGRERNKKEFHNLFYRIWGNKRGKQRTSLACSTEASRTFQRTFLSSKTSSQRTFFNSSWGSNGPSTPSELHSSRSFSQVSLEPKSSIDFLRRSNSEASWRLPLFPFTRSFTSAINSDMVTVRLDFSR